MAGIFSFAFLFSFIALIIGLVRPSVFSRLLPVSRKIQSLVFGGIFIFSTVVIGIITPATPTKNVEETSKGIKGISTDQISPEPITTVVPTQLPTQTPSPTNTSSPTNKPTPTPTRIVYPTATQVPFVYPTSIPVPQITTQTTNGGWVCNCSKTCPNISSCEEAQYLLNSCECGARDNDKDGIACDGAPLHCQD